MRLALKTFGVDLVDVLSAGWSGSKPAAGRYHFQAAERRIIPRSASELRGNPLARQFRRHHIVRRELCQVRLLLRCRRRVEPRIAWRAKLGSQLAVIFTRVLACAGSNF